MPIHLKHKFFSYPIGIMLCTLSACKFTISPTHSLSDTSSNDYSAYLVQFDEIDPDSLYDEFQSGEPTTGEKAESSIITEEDGTKLCPVALRPSNSFSPSQSNRKKSKDTKVMICHSSTGRQQNAHTIIVAEPAVAAHQRNHHDTLGRCPNEKEGDPVYQECE